MTGAVPYWTFFLTNGLLCPLGSTSPLSQIVVLEPAVSTRILYSANIMGGVSWPIAARYPPLIRFISPSNIPPEGQFDDAKDSEGHRVACGCTGKEGLQDVEIEHRYDYQGSVQEIPTVAEVLPTYLVDAIDQLQGEDDHEEMFQDLQTLWRLT